MIGDILNLQENTGYFIDSSRLDRVYVDRK